MTSVSLIRTWDLFHTITNQPHVAEKLKKKFWLLYNYSPLWNKCYLLPSANPAPSPLSLSHFSSPAHQILSISRLFISHFRLLSRIKWEEDGRQKKAPLCPVVSKGWHDVPKCVKKNIPILAQDWHMFGFIKASELNFKNKYEWSSSDLVEVDVLVWHCADKWMRSGRSGTNCGFFAH